MLRLGLPRLPQPVAVINCSSVGTAKPHWYFQSALPAQLQSSSKSTSKPGTAWLSRCWNYLPYPRFVSEWISLAFCNSSARLIDLGGCWEPPKGKGTPQTKGMQKRCVIILCKHILKVKISKALIWLLKASSVPSSIWRLGCFAYHRQLTWRHREFTAHFGWPFPLGMSFHKSFTSLTTYSCSLSPNAAHLEFTSSWYIQIQLSFSA